MNNPLGVSPSKGNQGTTRGKEKTFDLGVNRTHDLRIRSTVTLPTELRGWTERVRLILCFTICVHSATRHNIHMYPYFLVAAIHHLNRPRLSLSELVAQSAE